MKKLFTTERTITLTVEEMYYAVAHRYDLSKDVGINSVQITEEGKIEIRTTETGEAEL